MKLFKEIKKCLKNLDKNMGMEAKQSLMEMKFSDLYWCHFGLGLALRNNLLTEDSPLFIQFRKNGVDHPDDMSAVLVELYYLYLKNKILVRKTVKKSLKNN